ncbi:MAG: hypothetical protein AAF849_14150 [Bacteroidota bacterium]
MRKILPNNWEQFIKRSLMGYEVQWEEEALWEAIEQQLPEPKKRRPFLVVYFLLGTLLLLSSVYYLFGKFNDEQIARKDRTAIAAQEKMLPSIVDKEQSQIKRIAIPPEDQANSVRFDSDTKQDLKQREKIRQETNLAFTNTKAVVGYETLEQLPKLPIAPLPTTSGAVVQFYLRSPFQQSIAIDKIPDQPLLYEAVKIVKKETENHYPKVGISPYIGISFPHRKFIALHESATEQIKNRLQYEQPLESIEMGILLDLKFHKNWSFQFGLERQQLTERLDWQSSRQSSFNIQSDSAYFYFDDQNQKQYLAGELAAVETVTRSVRNYNRFTLYNIPMLLHYQQRNKRLGWRISGGAIFNFQHTFEGRFLENNALLETNVIRERGIYRSHLGLAWQLGAGIDYAISPTTQLSFQLYHRDFLHPVTSKNLNFEQHYAFSGMNIGMRWYFN